MESLTQSRVIRSAGAALLCLGFTSCVTHQQYQESMGLARTYQTQVHDLEEELTNLRFDNERLQAQARGNEAAVLEASFSDSVQTRMGALQGMLENLGRPPGDIERFDVEGGYVYMIQDKVLFASGSAEIEEEGGRRLLELARKIGERPHGRIFVRGHTDADPVKKPETMRLFPHGNLDLSAERAVSVGALLIDQGRIEAADVVVAGFGQWEPVAPSDSADNKRLNRRVEIFVADPS